MVRKKRGSVKATPVGGEPYVRQLCDLPEGGTPRRRRSGLDYSQDSPYNTPVLCLSERWRVLFCSHDRACSSARAHTEAGGGDPLISFGSTKALDGRLKRQASS